MAKLTGKKGRSAFTSGSEVVTATENLKGGHSAMQNVHTIASKLSLKELLKLLKEEAERLKIKDAELID